MYGNLLRLRLVTMIAFLAILAGSTQPIRADSPTLPYGHEQAQYRLRDWSPELADELIEALEAYPDSLPPEKRGYRDSGYNWAFRYAELASLEALYRFPNATNATEWAWGHAYNAVTTGNQEAGRFYADLLYIRLNEKPAEVEGLASWFHTMEPRLDLVLTRIWGTPAGYTASYVAEVRNFWSGGYFWILQSAQGGYEIYQLQSAWDFDQSYAAGVNATYLDLTGDRIPEVITNHSHRGGSDWTFENQTLDIFDLSTVPPAKIEFWPESPARWLPAGSHWNFHMNDAGQMIFQIEWYLDTYVCRQQFQSEFLLQGNVFIEQERHDMPTLLEFMQHTASPEYEPLCLDFYFGRLLREAANGHATALGMANEQLNILELALQTEAADGFRPVRPDYPDYVEEQRFKLAIILASQGDYAEARFLLTRLASQSSNWSGAAWQFLQSYEHPADFLTACAWAKECVEYLSLQKLLSQLVPTQLAELSTLFTGSFLRVESHLVQDLDGDSIPEQFLTLAKVNHDPQTWLLTVQDEKVVPFWMAYHDDGRIEQVTATDSHLGLPTYHLSGLSRFGAAFDVFFVQEQDDAGTAQYRPIGQYDYDFINSLESIAADLLEGEIAPEIALGRVRAVMSSPTFLCTEQRIQWTCHHQHLAYYLVGLTHELMSQEAQAVAAYLTLIEEFPDTPYAIMAAAKLAATSWDG